MQTYVFVGLALLGLAVLAGLSKALLGWVLVREDQVGHVVRKFGARNLPQGRIVALDGEAGYQARTLAPGVHFWY
jgi:hypothetical protein